MVGLSRQLFAEVLAFSLGRHDDIDVVHHGAMGGAEAVAAFERVQPDVALLDYVLSGADGPEATRAIVASSPQAKVLLLSWTHGPEQVEKALVAGARGFLPKSLSVAQVVDAVRQVHRGRPLAYGEDLADLVDDLSARIERGDDLRARLMSLTRRELEILVLLGEGHTTKEVARELSTSTGTIKNSLTRIFAKTGARTRLEVINWARALKLI